MNVFKKVVKRNNNGIDSNDLARKLKEGDTEAGEKLFNYFGPLIYRHFASRILNRHMAQDLTQEVFLKAISKIKTFEEKSGDFSSWIWQIAKNTLVDFYRKKKEIDFSDIENVENEFRLVDNSIEKAIYHELLEAVKNFTEEEQEIFSLHYVSDLSYKEISKITGKSEGALRVVIHRLNKKLKSLMK